MEVKEKGFCVSRLIPLVVALVSREFPVEGKAATHESGTGSCGLCKGNSICPEQFYHHCYLIKKQTIAESALESQVIICNSLTVVCKLFYFLTCP